MIKVVGIYTLIGSVYTSKDSVIFLGGEGILHIKRLRNSPAFLVVRPGIHVKRLRNILGGGGK